MSKTFSLYLYKLYALILESISFFNLIITKSASAVFVYYYYFFVCCCFVLIFEVLHSVLIFQSDWRITNWSSWPEVFCEKGVFKNIAIFTGKHRFWILFLIIFIKKRHQHRCFPVNIAEFLKTLILKYIC